MFVPDIAIRRLVRLCASVLLAYTAACSATAQSTPTLDDFWAGKAHFVERRTIDWTKMPGGTSAESSAWFAIDKGTWYAFNRAPVPQRSAACPEDNMQAVVRASSNSGKTWTAPVVVAAPGDSKRGDGCAILDGASVYDTSTNTWHILAQCLALHNVGGWAMCHYSRHGRSPLGAFFADPHNPVVTPGMLWSKICAQVKGSCDPTGTRYEGTPDIIRRTDGRYDVTFHGYEPQSGMGVRGIAITKDFNTWQTMGDGLPLGPMLGVADCRKWMRGCVGVGTATTLNTKNYSYYLFEAMDRNLGCTPDQQWAFSIVRAPKNVWLPSGSSKWQIQPGAPLITPTRISKGLPCPIQYARWFTSLGTTWLIYEERQPGTALLLRRLLQLIPGPAPARIVLKG